MPRARRIPVPPGIEVPEIVPPELNGAPDLDDLTDEELEQRELGDIGLLSDPSYQDWEWHIHRIRDKAEMAANPQGGNRELMGRRTGPIDLIELQEQFGGGVFELWGFKDIGDGRGKRLRKKPSFVIAGPRKRFDLPAAAVSLASVSVPGTDPVLVRVLEAIDQRLGKLEQSQTAAPVPTLKDMAETMLMLDKLRAPQAVPEGDPSEKIVHTYFAMVEKGIELGQAREPIGERGGIDWAKAIEVGAPLLERLLSRAAARRPLRPGAAPPPPAGEASGAAVVEEAPPQISHRWATAIESMAGAIASGEDPSDFAVTLERILNQQELGMLRLSTTDKVMNDLAAAGDALPILRTPEARSFVDATLAELRNPSTEDGSSPS